MTKEEYIKKYGRKTNKCLICKKHYRLPNFIYEPRDKICFTCELKLKILCKDCGEATKDSLAEELELCQECWEKECDRDWWREVKKQKFKKNNMEVTLLILFLIIVTLFYFCVILQI